MGWVDKVKVWLGGGDDEQDDAPRAQLRINPRDRSGRPSLDNFEPASQETLDDALAARELGDLDEMRRLLRQMDRGRGLRMVLRAAAALEHGDEATLAQLLPRIREETPAWRLPLQVAAALDDDGQAAELLEVAKGAGAPKWALAWSDACATGEERSRQGLVALLFADVALARTVAARDLALDGAEADPLASKRYVSFAHGRDCIRRFGAGLVADVLTRALDGRTS